MAMHSRPGTIWIGFGHKTGDKSVSSGNAFRSNFKQPGVVGGAQCIIAVQKVDFKLADTTFRDCGIGGNIHRVTGGIQIG